MLGCVGSGHTSKGQRKTTSTSNSGFIGEKLTLRKPRALFEKSHSLKASSV